MFIIKYILILIYLYGIVSSVEQINPKTRNKLVKLNQDSELLEGQYETTTRNKGYVSFYGIPFANPPLGDLRFKDPLPPMAWNGTLKADKQREICIQLKDSNDVIGSEDCLYLNIFTTIHDKDKLPVMVYIHGGAFVSGTPALNADVLLENDIVVVSIAYRLGVIGFMSLDTEEVPGNAGLKDQALALQWIKRNIDRFGGDENNITIFGISAGGTSVNNHQLSPMSKGLFNKVIAMSGTYLTPWGIQRNPQQMLTNLTRVLNIDITDKSSLLDRLQKCNLRDLVIASSAVQSDPAGFSEEPSFGPIIETHFNNTIAFFDKDPKDYVNDHDFFDVPVIFGHTSKEYLSFTTKQRTAEIINNNINIVPKRWRVVNSQVTIDTIAKLIKKFYFNQENDIDINYSKNFDIAIDVLSDVTFIMPTIETVRLHVSHSKSNIYHYRFTFRGSLNNKKIEDYNLDGATHGDDIRYLFVRESPRVGDETPEGRVRTRLADMFINFAKKGNPNCSNKNRSYVDAYWHPVTKTHNNYLEINNESIPSVDPEENRRMFWHTLEEKLDKGNI